MVACSEFLELLQSATHGMFTWELNSRCEDVKTVVPLIPKLLTKFPVILDQPQESGPMVVYGDAASVAQLKLRVKEATSPSDDDFDGGKKIKGTKHEGQTKEVPAQTAKHVGYNPGYATFVSSLLTRMPWTSSHKNLCQGLEVTNHIMMTRAVTRMNSFSKFGTVGTETC